MRKTICVILILILAAIMVFSGYQIFRELKMQKESADIYTDLEDFIDYPEETDGVPDETQSGETEAVTVGPTIDFAGLKEINDDCVAWIYIEDTVINYPVLQGSDNAYYLKHQNKLIIVPENSFFVLGDNADHSFDQQKEKTKTGSFSVKGNANDRTVAMTIGGPINLESDTLSTAKRLKNSVRKKKKLTAIFRTA